MTPISLCSLLARLPDGWALSGAAPDTADDLAIADIAEDSRRVRPGTLFVAHRGRDADGHRFIPAALRAGAVAVAGELDPAALEVAPPAGVPYWRVRDGRVAFAQLAAAFFDYPGRRMTVIGVTGTDGKTTTSTLLHSILETAAMRPGLLSTIAAQVGGEALDTGFHVTTPGAFDLQGYLARMVDAGCQVAVVETTSHGLDQHRVDCLDYDVAVVTNVTHEHLDWHGSWENYMAAKARLFAMLGESARKPGVAKCAVLNRDDRSFAYLEPIWAERRLTYSARGDAAAELTARDVAVGRDATRFVLHGPMGELPVRLRLPGRYNVANALAAAGAALALGVAPGEIAAGLERVERVRGRMEWVYAGEFDVVVDFAHTPNALKEAIALAREVVRPGGRVVVVFGSAGLRDVEKRRLMGEEACAADLAVLTAEDPRTEDLDAIIAAIADGLTAHGRVEGRDFIRVPDRSAAIATAIDLARPGDVVLTCGKAHEASMCYGTVETPWDEFAAVRAGLEARGLGA